MKVKIRKWNAVATWRWDIPDDDVCGICQVDFDGTCPTCKYPGDDCSLRMCCALLPCLLYSSDSICNSLWQVWAQLPYGMLCCGSQETKLTPCIALHCGVDQTRFVEGTMPNVQTEYVVFLSFWSITLTGVEFEWKDNGPAVQTAGIED
jgi:anaphase-promoting complex subunit 11